MVDVIQAKADGGAPEKAAPRRMLSERQVLEIVPVGRTTLYRIGEVRPVSEIYVRLPEPASLVSRRSRGLAERR